MYCGTYGYNNYSNGYNYGNGRFGGIAFILVLFILLAIIYPTFESKHCC